MLDIRDHGGNLGGINGSSIKNVIRGTSTINSGNLSLIVTIPTVDVSKSVVVITGLRSSSYLNGIRANQTCTSAKITASDKITFSKQATVGVGIVISWMVVEFKSVKGFFNTNTTFTSGQFSKTVTTPNFTGGQVLTFISYTSANIDDSDIASLVSTSPTVSHDGVSTLTLSRTEASRGNITVECYVVSL